MYQLQSSPEGVNKDVHLTLVFSELKAASYCHLQNFMTGLRLFNRNTKRYFMFTQITAYSIEYTHECVVLLAVEWVLMDSCCLFTHTLQGCFTDKTTPGPVSVLSLKHMWKIIRNPGIIVGMGSANERRRYNVTSSLIGLAYTHNDPWVSIHNKTWIICIIIWMLRDVG